MKNLSNIICYEYCSIKLPIVEELDPPFEDTWEILYIIRFHVAEYIKEGVL